MAAPTAAVAGRPLGLDVERVEGSGVPAAQNQETRRGRSVGRGEIGRPVAHVHHKAGRLGCCQGNLLQFGGQHRHRRSVALGLQRKGAPNGHGGVRAGSRGKAGCEHRSRRTVLARRRRRRRCLLELIHRLLVGQKEAPRMLDAGLVERCELSGNNRGVARGRTVGSALAVAVPRTARRVVVVFTVLALEIPQHDAAVLVDTKDVPRIPSAPAQIDQLGIGSIGLRGSQLQGIFHDAIGRVPLTDGVLLLLLLLLLLFGLWIQGRVDQLGLDASSFYQRGYLFLAFRGVRHPELVRVEGMPDQPRESQIGSRYRSGNFQQPLRPNLGGPLVDPPDDQRGMFGRMADRSQDVSVVEKGKIGDGLVVMAPKKGSHGRVPVHDPDQTVLDRVDDELVVHVDEVSVQMNEGIQFLVLRSFVDGNRLGLGLLLKATGRQPRIVEFDAVRSRWNSRRPNGNLFIRVAHGCRMSYVVCRLSVVVFTCSVQCFGIIVLIRLILFSFTMRNKDESNKR
mmetsp:Transcript_5999/g.14896  ORF Transcript_5999/g.14896 Transcript_5999/m.14896 type:complete len:509 (+) Transcript_5999:831-2357(+)